jgi:hypothetical protein
MNRSHYLALSTAAAILLTQPVQAQCTPQWLDGADLPGADGFVAASTTWDPDGGGPEPELLVIAGGFQVIGDRFLRGLAGFDGQTWRELDPDSQGDIYSINSLAVYQGDLYVAGSFSTLSGVPLNNVARFDGQDWHPLGSGPDNGITSTFGFAYVNTIEVLNGRLLVGGRFDLAGGGLAVNVAAWDGSDWSALGEGLSVGQFYEGVFGFAEFDGAIVAAGDFTLSGAAPVSGVASFDGTSWNAFAPFPDFFPFEVGTYQGQLLASGAYFDVTNPNPNYFGDSIVVAWDDVVGAWIPLGETLGTPGFLGVSKLVEFQGDLYAGGDFSDDIFNIFDAPGLLRRWDGQQWQLPGAGLGGFTGFQPTVASLAEHQGELIACGSFNRAGAEGAVNIAAWNETDWRAFGSGTNGWVMRLVEHMGGVVASGLFDVIEGIAQRRIAFWDGSTWEQVGDGSIANPAPLGEFQGELVVTDFALPGRIRHWDGTAWQPFGAGIEDGNVQALAVYKGQLVVGGQFVITNPLGEEINSIAGWDGTYWRPLGLGVVGEFFATVRAMTVYKGQLVVAGGLNMAGGRPVHAIAVWNGEVWREPSGGLTHSMGAQVFVTALAVYKGELYAAGQFDLAGGVPARNIARWDGKVWNALGPNGEVTLFGPGEALAEVNRNLYVGGRFGVAGGVMVSNVAQWDGATWSDLDGGVDPNGFGQVRALAGAHGQLLVGGEFVQAGSEVSAYLARWGCD